MRLLGKLAGCCEGLVRVMIIIKEQHQLKNLKQFTQPYTNETFLINKEVTLILNKIKGFKHIFYIFFIFFIYIILSVKCFLGV